jgi:hypothetical protein
MPTEIKHYISESSESSESSFIDTEHHSIASSEKSSIRFSPEVYCMATLTRSEYTYAEARSTWLLEDEKADMMEKYAKTAQRMKSGKKPKRNSTYRGLETMLERDIEEMEDIVHTCVHTVLDEQDTQWEEDTFRWGRFAKISRRSSKNSKALALKRAKSDEREAKKAYRQMELSTGEHSFHSTSSFSVESFRSPQSIKSRRNVLSSKILLVTPCSLSPALVGVGSDQSISAQVARRDLSVPKKVSIAKAESRWQC